LIFHASIVILNATNDETAMAQPKESSVIEVARLAAVARLLGGQNTLHKIPRSRLEAHEMLRVGLSGKALVYLIEHLSQGWDPSLASVLRVSQRTYQRRAATAAKRLKPEQAARTWKFAEILARAIDVFGSKAEAERWLKEPAIGLDQRRPIDLLDTPAGVELVEDLLVRLDYGVYT
jgi:putative toxin-antitoxin system antitoxin component (TIGR02293 family)